MTKIVKLYEQHSAEERATIMSMQHEGSELRKMARLLKRFPSTISRALGRDFGAESAYIASLTYGNL